MGVSALRTAIGTLTLLPVAVAARRLFPRDAGTWLAFALLGLLNFAAPWTLVALSQEHIPSSVASIVNSAMPFWTAIFAVMLVRNEKLGPVQLAGLLVGFLGVVALLGEGLGDLHGDSVEGVLLMLGATAFAGLSSVIIRRWLTYVAPLALTVGQVGFATVALVPVALLTGAYGDAHVGPGEIGSAIALGGLGSGLAVMIFMWLIAEIGPVRATVVTYIIPPIGVFLGWAVLGEPIGWNLVAGLLLIAAGVGLVQGIPGLRLGLSAPPRVRPAEE
jgi:drug/metabolite transporter (DMT)-like permease